MNDLKEIVICDYCNKDLGERVFNNKCQYCGKFPCNLCQVRHWRFTMPFSKNSNRKWHTNLKWFKGKGYEDYVCRKCNQRVPETFWDSTKMNLGMIVFFIFFAWVMYAVVN